MKHQRQNSEHSALPGQAQHHNLYGNSTMAESAYYPSYRPPLLPKNKALLQNALSLRPSPWTAAFGAGSISLSPLAESPEFSAACTLSVDIDGTLWQVELDDTAVLMRHDIFHNNDEEPPAFDERALPPEVRRALLEAMLEPALSSLRSCLNLPLLIRDVQFPASPVKTAFSTGFHCRLSACNGLPELTVFLRLSPLNGDDASVLTQALRSLPLRTDGPLKTALKAVPLEVALESGYLVLKPEEVDTLAPEDVLLPEAWTAPETLKLLVRRGNAPVLSAVCTVAGDRLTISSPLSQEPESSMENPELNEIDIRLSFELDRRIITVGNLESLTPGYTFTLNCDVMSPVTIRANGKAIARGRLVDLDGTLGVQIAETL